MVVTVNVSGEFERQAKRLAKKYKSFVDDFSGFLNSIKGNPYIYIYDKQEISNVSDKYINQIIKNLK